MRNDLECICGDLKQLQSRLKFCEKSIYKQENMMSARIRQALGWQAPAYDDEAEFDDGGKRKESKAAAKIRSRAANILKRHCDGKAQDPEDEPIAEVLIVELELVRRGIEPYKAAMDDIIKRMVEIAKTLPVHPWQKKVAGFGEKGLAVIIAEAGDLSKYSTVSKLWKRLGLAPYNGKAGSTWASPYLRKADPLTAQEWIGLGYQKQRRSQVHAFIGSNFRQHQIESKAKSNLPFGKPKTKYGEVYVDRKLRTLKTHPDWTPAHADNDALRVMAKAVIRDLWIEWNRAAKALETEPFREAAE